MATAMVVLLLTLIGAGVGFSVGIFMGDPEATTNPGTVEDGSAEKTVESSDSKEPGPEGEAASDDMQESEGLSPDELTLAPLPPVLTSLAEPKGKWIRLEGSIMISKASKKRPELLAEESGEQILAYLRTVRLNQLESPSGILGLRDDLDETVQTLSGGDVRGVLIHGLVVE